MSFIRPVFNALPNIQLNSQQVEDDRTAPKECGIPFEKILKAVESCSGENPTIQGRVVKIDSGKDGEEIVSKCQTILSRLLVHLQNQSTTAAEVVDLLYK